VYAIVKAGGKQYRVRTGDVLRLESLDVKVGSSVTLSEVLFLGGDGEKVTLGSPLVANASVVGTVLEQGRGAKIRIFKYKKRKHYRRTKGHRQGYTTVRIDKVLA
jgi:large subunit ribosomal protein L21